MKTSEYAVLFLAVVVLILGSKQAWAADAVQSLTSTNLEVLTSSQVKDLTALAQKPLEEQVAVIKKDVPVELLSSARRGGRHYFDFLGPAKKSIEEISEIEGLYGKATCPKAGAPAVLYIAEDAPQTTLIHEYAHFLQMKNEKRWCELDGRTLESDEHRERALLYHRFEFNVLKTMWEMGDTLTKNFEDRILIVEGLNRETTVLKKAGLKPLDEDTEAKLAKAAEDAQTEINLLTWILSKPEEGQAVLAKMDVLTLKACTEASSKEGMPLIDALNGCFKKRCMLTNVLCKAPEVATADQVRKYSDDLFSLIISMTTKNWSDSTCKLNDLKEELTGHVEEPTLCWKKWVDVATPYKRSAPLRLVEVSDKEGAKFFKAKNFKIDKQIGFFTVNNPLGFINRTYCYFIFQGVAKFSSLPIDQFAFATEGAALAVNKREEYVKWLKDDQAGQTCSKLVKAFTGETPSDLKSVPKHKNFLLIINRLASLPGGLQKFEDNVRVDVNHERLHLIFATQSVVRLQTKQKWNAQTPEFQKAFKEAHPSYDFSNEDILLREFYSYSNQDHPPVNL